MDNIRKAIIISISGNKGGIGKTSIVSNLAGILALNGARVLILDTDGQGNISDSFDLKEDKRTLYNVLLGKTKLQDAIINYNDKIDIIPAGEDMSLIEFVILPQLKTEYRRPFDLLKDAIQPIRANYDFILIDTPPSLGLIAGNALQAADFVLIPFVPETYAVKGLQRVIRAVDEFKSKGNKALEILAVVPIMVDLRTTLHTELLQAARQYCERKGIRVTNTVIPKSIRFATATAYEKKPATLSSNQSHDMVKAYVELTKEVLEWATIK